MVEELTDLVVGRRMNRAEEQLLEQLDAPRVATLEVAHHHRGDRLVQETEPVLERRLLDGVVGDPAGVDLADVPLDECLLVRAT